MKYQEIKNQSQEKYNNLLTECRVFWAFSDQQFEEGKIKIGFRETDPEEKLCRINGGGLLPSKNVDKMIRGMEEINKWERAEIRKYKQQDAEIKSELYNYECFYVGSPQEAIDRNPQYKPERVIKIYREEYKNAMRSL